MDMSHPVRFLFQLTIGAVIALLSFWAMLMTIDYLRRPSDRVAQAPASRGIPLFEQGKAVASNLMVTPNAGAGPEGARATRLEDNSPDYGVLFEDLPATPGMAGTFSVDLKAGTSPLVQLVMIYSGGTQKVYYVYVDTSDMKATSSEGDVTITDLGNGWWRVRLSGANDNSGNTSLRLSLYPRHGKPEDTGSLYIANSRLILAHPR